MIFRWTILPRPSRQPQPPVPRVMSNVGQSPIDYLTSYRISEACSLLKNSSLSIAEIAVSVGFF